MNKHYEKMIQSLNTVKWELKNRNDPTLNVCIMYIKDAIVEASKLNDKFELLESTSKCNNSDYWCDD